eukprot:1798813-Lingulodinium_polyedra.AAC.1
MALAFAKGCKQDSSIFILLSLSRPSKIHRSYSNIGNAFVAKAFDFNQAPSKFCQTKAMQGALRVRSQPRKATLN